MDHVGGAEGVVVRVAGKKVERGRVGTEVELIRISVVGEMRMRILYSLAFVYI